MNNLFDDIDADRNHFEYLYPDLYDDDCSNYYNIENFNEIGINSKTDLLLLNFNIRSLSANFDLFNGFHSLLNKKFNILCFTESWLTDNNKQLYSIPGYNDFHCLRNDGRRGGGLSMYISETYDTKFIKQSSISLSFIETLFVEIHKDNLKILVATIYKPPKCDDAKFIDKLTELLSISSKKNYNEIIITGDFNFDLLKYDKDNNVMKFLNSLTSQSLIPTISKPTRINDKSASLIDNIFMSNPSNLTAGIIVTDISDHFPVFVLKNSVFLNQNCNETFNIKYRLINEITLQNLHNELEPCDFSTIIDPNNCSLSIQNLTDVLDTAFKNCCPLKIKTVSYKDIKKPWITKEIIKLIKQRQNNYVLYSKNLITKKEYSKFRNYVTMKIRKAKIEYYDHKFKSIKNDIKQTWRAINNVINPKANKITAVKKISENNVTYVNPKEISNLFNNFFVNIGRKIAESVERNPQDHLQFLNHVNQPQSFFFQPVSPTEVGNIINSLKNKSSDINTMPIKILKTIKNIISFPLSEIINNSFTSGEFPDPLKVARVTPIFKEGDKSKLSNYRPISVLPPLSKIFEKIAHNQLYKYLERHKILDPNQYGFRSKKSTTQAILNFMQYLFSNIDSGKIIFSIFLDFRKAFDTVDHRILLSKLNTYGIRGLALDWFGSYLSNRKQHVFINNSDSKHKFINYGVPQGSILGPLLFLVFINDISQSSNLFKYILYADDSTLSTCVDNLNNLHRSAAIINSELNKVYLWLKANSITINEDKTKYMLFSYNKNISLPEIKIGKNVIPETSVTKFPGVYFDNGLNFSSHINILSKKISKTIGLLFKLNKFLPSHILQILYTSLVQPYLIYGLEAWYSTYKNHTNKIFILQKKAIRAANKLDYNEHTNNYFKSNFILKLEDQFKLQISIYVYKLLNLNADPEIESLLYQNSIIHQFNTRSTVSFNVSFVNRSKSKNCIAHNGIKIWNNLPEDMRNSKSLYNFKKKVKAFLHGKY